MITPRAKLKLSTALLALLWMCQTEAESFVTRDLGVISDSIKSVPRETKEILRYPVDHTNEFIQYAAGIGALIIVDRPVTQFYQDHIEDPIKDFKLTDAPDPFKNIGTGGTDGWLVLGISSTYLTGLMTNNTYTQKVGIAATKAIGYSFALDQVILKTLTGRNRPPPSLSSGQIPEPYTNNPYDFFNGREGIGNSSQQASSFASYHFTTWFAVAKVYQRAYDNYWLPYSLATLGLASNIKGHRHWVSDMVAGAIFGTLIGTSISDHTFSNTRTDGELSFTVPPTERLVFRSPTALDKQELACIP